MRKRLSKQEKVKILILAKQYVNTVDCFRGVCGAIKNAVGDVINWHDYPKYSAKLFGAYSNDPESKFWWPITAEGSSKRQEFLDWMIQELSKKKDPFWKRLIILRNEKS